MKKLDVYTLGQYGVNRVRSPIHVNDGEVLNAQNATIKLVKGQLALSKRDGMVTINDDAAAGIILNISNIPLKTIGGSAICNYSPDVPDAQWQDACYSPELDLFVAVGFAGAIMTSTDGETWTLGTGPSATNWNGVCWSSTLSKFVAVGGDNLTAASQVMTSPDGVTWTNQTASGDRDWIAVCWSADLNLFVACANTGSTVGMIMTSPTGVTWTNRTPPSGGFRKVIWASELSLFIAVSSKLGSSNEVCTSPDGINWTLRDIGTNTGLYGVAYSPTLNIAVAAGKTDFPPAATFYYSTNGTTWTASTSLSGTSNWIWNVVWSPDFECFFGIYHFEAYYAISFDGINWQKVALNCGGVNNIALSYSDALEEFMILGENNLGEITVEMIGNT